MRILIVSQYFWPEPFIINQVCVELVNQGNQVVVLTGKPNYPEGSLYPGYTFFGCVRERVLDAVDVVRIPIFPRYSGAGKNLVLNYISFVLSGLFFSPWLLRHQHFDAILVFAPSPITAAIPAIYLKWIKRCQLSIWVQDLWPDSISATGFVKSKFILKCVGFLVKLIYANASNVLVQSKGFIKPIEAYTHKAKIKYLPNSIDDQFINKAKKNACDLPKELLDRLESKFCLVFAGNIGHVQAVETIIGAAERVLSLEDVEIIFVGGGSKLKWAQKEVAEQGISNVFFAGRYEMDIMPHIYCRAEALLVALNDEKIFSCTVPSKIQAYLSAGKPILCALNGEGARIVNEAHAGISTPPADSKALAEAIRKIRLMSPSERNTMGMAGRKYFLQHFELSKISSKLLNFLKIPDV